MMPGIWADLVATCAAIERNLNKTAEAAPASAIKEAIICAEPTDNDSTQ